MLSCYVRPLPNTFYYAIVCLYSVGPSWLQNKIFGHGPTFWWWSRPGTQYSTTQFYLIKLLNRELMLLTYYVWIHFNWWWCWRRGQYWGWQRMPDITHVKQAFSFFYSFHISHLKKKKNFKSFLFWSSSRAKKRNLICAETWPAGRSCLWDDIHQVEKYRPPLAPMPILSFTAAITLLSCGQPRWHHPLNDSSKSYLLTPLK